MIRLARHLLTERDGRLFRGDEAFSGLAFQIHGDRSIATRVVEAGYLVESGRSRSDQPAQIDATGMLAESVADVPMTWDGALFSGIAYEFNQGHCVHEAVFDAGAASSERWWNAGGSPLSESHFGGVQRLYEWHPDGRPKSASIDVAGQCTRGFGFAPDGRLIAMSLRGTCGTLRLEHPEGFDLPADEEAMARVQAAGSLYLSGDGIGDRLLLRLIDTGALHETQVLRLADSSVTGGIAPRLASLPNLLKLVVFGEAGGQLQLAAEMEPAGIVTELR